MGLARLLARRGRSAEARTDLAQVYSWFTEGFETADLRAARTLLDELGGPTS
jgi:adenylate cyclase